MKNAEEMRKIVENFNEEKNRKEDKIITRIVEEKIFPQILRSAKRGEIFVKYQVDASVNISKVENLLKKNGYEIFVCGNTLEISW